MQITRRPIAHNIANITDIISKNVCALTRKNIHKTNQSKPNSYHDQLFGREIKTCLKEESAWL